ncbi:hypothetical protein VXS06_14665 [Photobacterium toruni]|uniref:DUF4178 domain-containing protein n=1 Tax=Photobacterium toruni TaxID=1935446 RepID=A0ABU6L8Y6_9GAMM|nr:hypothetical protein [Photobacterium toruni]
MGNLTKRESGWYWVKHSEWWAVMLWDSEDEIWLVSGIEYPTLTDYDMQEIDERQITRVPVQEVVNNG